MDYHLQPLAQRVKCSIKDTYHFLNKIKKTGKLPEGAILCTMDVVGIYSNIPHGKGLPLSIGFWKLEITNISGVIL